MEDYSLILFDLDGTLTDPWEGITASVLYALNKMNIEEPDRHKLTAFIGPPLVESFEEFYGLDPEQAWLAVEYYREYFAEQGMYQNRVYSGIPQLLQDLHSHGATLGVATSKPTFFSEQILRHFHLDTYFARVIGSNMDGSRVAKGDIIRVALEQIGSSPSTALMVGDRKHDIEGARQNHMDSLAVAYGYGSREELAAAQPSYLAASVAELHRLLMAP